MRRLSFLFLCLLLFLSNSAFSQCKNSIALKGAFNENGQKEGGVIEISVVTSKDFTCSLSREEGSGPQKITEKKGGRDSIVKFEGLDVNSIYLVQFEFLSEDKKLCSKLQLSQIVIEDE